MKTFRIDDIGASTKHFEQHGRKSFYHKGKRIFYFPFANWWFLKRIPPFRKWGIYEELTREEWLPMLKLLKKNNIKPIIAITATWVEKDGTFTSYPEKFPKEAAILKEAAQKGDMVIANHGLTHCVVGKHLPRVLSSNRRYHREFYPEFDQEYHNEHVRRSQEILESYFEMPIEILVPPGNVWSIKTYHAVKRTNIKKIICNASMQDSDEKMEGIEFVNDKNMFCFHDMELKRYGLQWLAKKITENL